MKRGLHHFLIAIIVAVSFLLYATIGYGAYSDSLNVRCSISGYIPTDVPLEDGSLVPSEVSGSLDGELPLITPGPNGEDSAALPGEGVNPAEEIPLDALPGESQNTPEPTAELITEEARASMSRKLFIDGSSTAGWPAPFFSGAYTDRSGSHVQREEQPVCHWEKKTLVAYGSVFVPQNGLPGSAILADMCIDMGAAIRFDNTTGADIVLTCTSASSVMAQSFFNDTDKTLNETSVRLSPGQSGVVSAYLDHGWQLSASELDLERLPGMLCPREFKMSFQVENLTTGECQTYAILLVIQVSTQAPVETLAPTEEIVPTDETGMVTPEPIPTPEATNIPTAELTPEPVPEPTAEMTPEPVPEPTAEMTAESILEPTTKLTSEPVPEPTAELTPEPIPELTPEPIPEMISNPTLAPVSTDDIGLAATL